MTARADILSLFHPVRTSEMERVAVETIRSGQIAAGPNVALFEREFGALIGREHVVATSDMTSALVLALRLAGVQPGDEVATLAFSCLSSNSAISAVGARPVWVDIDPATASMCPTDLGRALTSKTKAVTVYHVAGYPARMKEIKEVCRQRGVVLIEDCNNALGAKDGGRRIGTTGTYAVYSFYPNRQINALEGGALVCPDKDTAMQARKLRRFGIDTVTFRDLRGEINPESDVPELGLSAAMSNLNAGVALTQLPSLTDREQCTATNVQQLRDGLQGAKGVELVTVNSGMQSAHWGLLMLAQQRDMLLAALKGRGIQASALHHRNDNYSGFHAVRRDLPGTSRALAQMLALPCGWWLNAEQIDTICTAVIAELR